MKAIVLLIAALLISAGTARPCDPPKGCCPSGSCGPCECKPQCQCQPVRPPVILVQIQMDTNVYIDFGRFFLKKEGEDDKTSFPKKKEAAILNKDRYKPGGKSLQ